MGAYDIESSAFMNVAYATPTLSEGQSIISITGMYLQGIDSYAFSDVFHSMSGVKGSILIDPVMLYGI